MQVQFTNTNKRENSTAIPSSFSATRSCVLKNASSIINPVIELDRTVNDHTYNYCYIADFSRYYWVRDIVYEDARIIYYLDCDVLASARTFIGNASMYVLRAAHEWDGTITDTLYPRKAETVTVMNLINTGVGGTEKFSSGTYSVGIRNTQGVDYYLMQKPEFDAFCYVLLGDGFANEIIGNYGIVNNQYKMLVDPLQYIERILWFPFTTTAGTSLLAGDMISVGNAGLDFSTVQGADITHVKLLSNNNIADMIETQFISLNTYMPIQHPQANTRGVYLNSPMFTNAMFTLLPFGQFALDWVSVQSIRNAYAQANSFLRARVDTDLRTGNSTLNIECGGAGNVDKILAHANAQIGVNIPLAQTIERGERTFLQEVQMNLDAWSTATKLDVSGTFGVVNAAIHDEIMSHIPEHRKQGETSSIINVYNLYFCYLMFTFSQVVDDDLSQRGRPLCEVRQLSTMAGYQLIADADIRTTLTAEEDRKIKQFLESGYFYE